MNFKEGDRVVCYILNQNKYYFATVISVDVETYEYIVAIDYTKDMVHVSNANIYHPSTVDSNEIYYGGHATPFSLIAKTDSTYTFSNGETRIKFDKDWRMVSVKESRMTSYSTGAKREDKALKGRMDLLPWMALIEVAKHFEQGCENHGERNWEQGLPLSSYVSSEARHLGQVVADVQSETEDKMYHLRANAWNAICLLQTYMWIEQGVLPAELNDLPSYNYKGKN